jgi:hypothetical protein
VKPTALFGQAITNQVAVWALINAAITLHMAVFGGLRPRFDYRWGLAALAALITVAVGYGAAMLADRLFLIDFRFWVVALKVFSPDQAKIALIYLPAFLVFFLITLRSLHARFAVKGEGVVSQYMTAVVALAGGFLMLLGIDYGLFFATGALPTAFDPLSTVVAIQFMPLLSIIAIIAVFTWRRTNSYVPGAFICALFTTWYVVAGTATQVTLGTP